MSTPTTMVTALVQLRAALDAASLPLDVPHADERRALRTELVDQLEDYVLPRLIQIDAPLLAVVGGSTGAGKSTLVNSVVGTRVTEPGVLRPTTRSPVLVHNPADAEWFDGARILPHLARTTGSGRDTGTLQLVAAESVPAGLAILDAPDIDSVEDREALGDVVGGDQLQGAGVAGGTGRAREPGQVAFLVEPVDVGRVVHQHR